MKKFLIILVILQFLIIIGLIVFNRMCVSDIEKMNALSMNLEIERKWLVNVEDIPYDYINNNIKVEKIEQTYLNFSPEIRVRNVNDGQYYVMTMKGYYFFDKIVRAETDYVLSKEEYDILLQKREWNTIYKTRYVVSDKDLKWEFDIFSGDLEGLAYLEIEFESVKEAEAFEEPSWVVKEVTDDLNYKNRHLARYGIPDSYAGYMEEYNKNK